MRDDLSMQKSKFWAPSQPVSAGEAEEKREKRQQIIAFAGVAMVSLASLCFGFTRVPVAVCCIPLVKAEYHAKVELPLEQAVNADTTAEARQGVQKALAALESDEPEQAARWYPEAIPEFENFKRVDHALRNNLSNKLDLEQWRQLKQMTDRLNDQMYRFFDKVLVVALITVFGYAAIPLVVIAACSNLLNFSWRYECNDE